MALPLSYRLYWPIRMLGELAVVLVFLAGVTKMERNGELDFLYFELPDWLRLHLLYAIVVFWLARWRPWTFAITGGLYAVLMLLAVLMAGAFFMTFPLFIFALGLIIYAAYRLGKSQHRKRAT